MKEKNEINKQDTTGADTIDAPQGYGDERFIVDSLLAISFKDGIKVRKHYMRQPTLANLAVLEAKYPEWMEAFWNRQVKHNETTSYRDAFLWELCAEKVEGYTFDGSSNWLEKTPAQHKLMLAKEITKVKAISETDVVSFYGEGHLVDDDDEYVTVYTAADQYVPKYGRVLTLLEKHTFTRPSLNDFAIYERTTAMSQTMKGNKVRFESQTVAKELCAIYDRLFVRVSGYADANGDVTAAASVPPLHKINAVRKLFTVGEMEIQESEGN